MREGDGGKIADAVLGIARSEDIPVLGMGPCAAMSKEPTGYRPEDLLPRSKSMICFGIPVPRSVFRESRFIVERIWRSQSLYYRRLDTLSLRLAQVLEAFDAEAAPVFGCAPLAVNRRGIVVGHLNQIRMAMLTGIGTRGRNGLLLHSRYGARLMLGAIVTTACLPSLRMPETSEPGCPVDCRICIDACPARAISARSGRVDVMRCLSYAAQTPFMPRLRFAILARLKPAAAERLLYQRAFDEHTTEVCSQCVTQCPYGEGKTGEAPVQAMVVE